MSTKTMDLSEVVKEIRFAEDSLYYVANELLRMRPSDPMARELASIAENCSAAARVLEQREKR
jgi:hypothetical protein